MDAAVPRVFLLSPAHAGGLRARMLRRPEAEFDLARRLRRREASLGEVFAFLSGLYFRGKLAYARRFARTAGDVPGVLVITTNQGLVEAGTLLDPEALQAFADVQIDAGEPRYVRPLTEGAERLRDAVGDHADVVLLGSIATGKYVDILLAVFGERLLFPKDFVGRGDMSRGALLLRQEAAGCELDYIPVAGAVRRGRRAPGVATLQG